jgi:Ca-activated chloride channel family protein
MKHSRALLSLSLCLSIPCVSVVLSVPISTAEAAEHGGVISGVVKDTNTDAAIPNALVVLQCACLSAPREALTNARGIYAFDQLPPGSYTIQVLAHAANVSKIVELPRDAKFRANFAVDPEADAVIEIVVDAAPIASNPATSMRIGMEEAKQLPVGNSTSRDFTAVVDLAATASRDVGGEGYAEIDENRYRATRDEKISTFSIDVDTASYANVRRFLNDGTLPPAEAVRAEELLNYFSYDYPTPSDEHPFSVSAEVSECPWNQEARLMHIGLRGKDIGARQPARNLVFLLDVSGSMDSPDKLPLLVDAMKLLVQTLEARDHVAIVVYAGASGVVLPPTSGSDRMTILTALDRLSAGGSTNGGEGIERAYALARASFDPQAVNRVILATDGDFNVGTVDEAALQRLIERERESGVFLSVLGLGTGNLQDATMELLADKGNGNYAYIDSFLEARKVLVEEAGSTLVTIAKDVKIQVEFDRREVAAYRLIGYENRALATEDFDDDREDAGEIGAGHSVTALYEIVLTDKAKRRNRPKPLAELRLRYKLPSESKSKRLSGSVVDRRGTLVNSSDDFRFAAAVAEFSLLLRRSPHAGSASFRQAKAMAEGALGHDPGGYRREFIALLEHAERLSNQSARPW